jgi:hypothetical protein
MPLPARGCRPKPPEQPEGSSRIARNPRFCGVHPAGRQPGARGQGATQDPGLKLLIELPVRRSSNPPTPRFFVTSR